jgi:hypothetical protein
MSDHSGLPIKWLYLVLLRHCPEKVSTACVEPRSTGGSKELLIDEHKFIRHAGQIQAVSKPYTLSAFPYSQKYQL